MCKDKRQLMTVKQAAEYLNLSESSLRNIMSQDRIPYIKITERRVRFDPDELDEWIDERRVSVI